MSIPLKQSTNGQVISLGQFVDPAALGTTMGALTIANTDIKLLKWGSTSFVNKNSGGATVISSGVYQTTLDSTDTNTLGNMSVFCTMAGAVPVRVECVVYAANIYDSIIAATDKLEVDATQFAGSTTAATRASQLYLYGCNTDTVAASPTPTTTSFAGALTGASYPDNCFRNAAVIFLTGSNASLTPRPISSFTSASSLYSFSTPLPFAPTAGTVFLIVGVTG